MKPDPDALRRIARAARPSGQDDQDPEILEALKQLREHPRLLEEIEAERELDREIAAEMQSHQPPPDFENQLLETLRTARAKAAPAEAPVAEAKPGPAMSRRHWLAMAASAAACAGGALWWRSSQLLPLDRLVDELAGISKEGVTLSLMSMVKTEVVGWLEENDAPRTGSMPLALDQLGRKGCHIYEIEGHRVSLECFLLPGMREIHLFTTPSSGVKGEPRPGNRPIYSKPQGQTAAVWNDSEHTMVLVTDSPIAEIRQLFG